MAAADAATGLLASNPWLSGASMGMDALKSLSTSSSASGQSSNQFDNSGWNVNFGSGSIDSKRSETPQGSQMVDQYLPYALAVVGLLMVWRLTRKKT